MVNKMNSMKKIISVCLLTAGLIPTAFSQLITLPGGGNKKASVSERIGLKNTVGIIPK